MTGYFPVIRETGKRKHRPLKKLRKFRHLGGYSLFVLESIFLIEDIFGSFICFLN